MGVKHLFITNAAGALNPSFAVGDVMFIKSHINIPSLVGVNALVGPSDARYPDVFDNLLHSTCKLTRRPHARPWMYC